MWVPIAIAVVVVVAVAWFAITLVTQRLEATPSRAVFDVEAATDFIADRLPDQVAAKLSHDDVRLLLRWELTYLRERGVATFGGVDHVAEDAALVDAPMVADEDEIVDELLARAAAEGLDIDAVDVVCVTDLAVTYLERIGAVGREIDTAGALPRPTVAGELQPGRIDDRDGTPGAAADDTASGEDDTG